MLKLFRFLRPYRVTVTVVVVLVFLQSLANLYLPTLMAHIVDSGILHGDTRYILRVGGFMLLVAIFGTGCAIAASYYSSQVAVGFGRIVRGEIFSHVERFSLN